MSSVTDDQAVDITFQHITSEQPAVWLFHWQS